MFSRQKSCLAITTAHRVNQIARINGMYNYEKLTHYSTFAAKNYHYHILLKTTIRTNSVGYVHRKLSSSGQYLFSQRKHEEFISYFPELVESLTSEEPWSRVPKFKEKLTEVLRSNLDLGTHVTGVGTVVIYEALEKCENLSPENIKLAIMLGWCGRMMESALLILDDIVDNSEIRDGKPCWFRNKHVGLKAIIDGVYMENSVYFILKKYFSNHPQYLALVEHFLDIGFKISLGQSLDLMPSDLDDFTIDYYNLLAIGKGECCVVYGPVVAAMLLANISDEELHQQVKPLLFSMGNYYRIQNDYLDCYGNPEDTGKIGSDIREGKCSWFAVKALEKANRSQRILMRENYGKNDDKSIQVIHNLYDEMNLKEEHRRCEERTNRNIRSKISKLPGKLLHGLFYMLLDKVHNRKWGA